MKENIKILCIAVIAELSIKYNPNPSIDWHSMLAGLALAAVSCGIIIAGKIFNRNDTMLAVATCVICFTEFDSFDKYAFFFGFGLCSLIPIIMLIGRDGDE